MKIKIVLIFSLLICTLTYSNIFVGTDSGRLFTAYIKKGKMENIIAGASRRKLQENEALIITLKQKKIGEIKNIRIESLPDRDHVDFLRIAVGRVYNFKCFLNGREINIGNIIYFPNNSKQMEIKILATYAGYSDVWIPSNGNMKVKTDRIGRIKLKYDTVSSGEKNKVIDIDGREFCYEAKIIPKVRVNVSGKMDFGQVIAGQSSRADVDVDVYFYNDRSTYEMPEFTYIENSNGNRLQVNLTDELYNYSTWDSHSKIRVIGEVQTHKNTPVGKYKGSFYVKFRFK